MVSFNVLSEKEIVTDPVTTDIFSLTEGVSNGRIRQWKKYEHESIVVSLTVYKVQEEHGFSVTSLFFPLSAENKSSGSPQNYHQPNPSTARKSYIPGQLQQCVH